ncbi:hypothetical protein FTUN_7958 [Frigoriglobus tundricola]|uniref:Uncharacterized protein n=1 Tax=Frigoriglobus tundricola TaxID=2774151 RepID=A0A6M5Z4D0_9BACT|nr:hypothetical protein FTUN_7958 [Frigoriglobus tundricola]
MLVSSEQSTGAGLAQKKTSLGVWNSTCKTACATLAVQYRGNNRLIAGAAIGYSAVQHAATGAYRADE